MSNSKQVWLPVELEFQRDGVAIVVDDGRSIADVAGPIGVAEGTWGKLGRQDRRECVRGQSLTE